MDGLIDLPIMQPLNQSAPSTREYPARMISGKQYAAAKPAGLLGNESPNIWDNVSNFIRSSFATPEPDYSKEEYDDARVLLEKAEGNHPFYYKDTKGIWTSGLGHTGSKPPKIHKIKKIKVGGIKTPVAHDMSGNVIPIDRTEVEERYKEDYETALKDARQYFGKDVFNNLPMKVKSGLISVSFNSGLNKLKGFRRLKKAVSNFSKTGKAFEDIPLNLLYIDPYEKNMRYSKRYYDTGGSRDSDKKQTGGRTEKELIHMLGGD